MTRTVTTTHTPADRSADSPMQLRGLAALLWRRRLVVGMVVAIVAAVVGTGLALAQEKYTATARVAVTPAAGMTESPANYDSLLSTVADVAQSRPLLVEVAENVDDRSLGDLRDAVSGSMVTGTVTVQVAVTDTDAERAAQVANAVIELLPQFDPTDGNVEFTTTEPATVPSSASWPNIPVTVLAGALFGLALAVAAAVALDRFARTVDSPEGITDAADVPVLGVVGCPGDARAVQALEQDSREFSDLRALRVALEFATSDDPTRCLVVTSVGTDPWSGWLEVNLSVSLAELGHRVLLIDTHRGDQVRHPALEAGDAAGFYDLLADSARLEDVVRPGPVDGVSVIGLGNLDLAAPSLLEMRSRRLIESIDGDYDVIVVHTAPVTESDDARILAIGGGVLLTVPAGKVKDSALSRAIADLRAVRTRVIGSVLLGVRRGQR